MTAKLGLVVLLGVLPAWSQTVEAGNPPTWYEAYAAPGNRPRGLVFDGAHLWSSDFGAMKFYRHRLDDSLTVEQVYDLPDRYFDLAWAEGRLYAVTWGRVDEFELPALQIAQTWSRPEEFHHMHGITWNGTHLLTAHVSDQIYEHLRDETFTIIQTYNNPDNSGGMTWDGRFLYVVSTASRSITKLSLEGGQATAVARYCTPGPVPTGIAWDGQHFWVADDQTDTIYRILELQTGTCDPYDVVLDPGTTTTPISGFVNGNATLTAAQSPYLLEGTLEVPEGATLTIEPGTRIFAASPQAGIQVRGALTAVGTPDSPIVFSHANPNETWEGLRFESSAGPNMVEFVWLLYAGIGITDSPIIVRHSVLRYNSGIGAFFYQDFSDDLVVEGNQIAYTFGAGVNVASLQQDAFRGHMRGNVTIRYNHFSYAGPPDLGNFSEWSGPVLVTNNIIDHEFGVSISLSSIPRFSVNENFMDVVDTGIGIVAGVESSQVQEVRRNLMQSVQSSALPLFFANGIVGNEFHLHENTIMGAQNVSSIQQQEDAPTNVRVQFTDNNFVDAIPIGGIPDYPVDGTNNWWGDWTQEDVWMWHQDAPGYGSVEVLPVRKQPIPVGYVTGVAVDTSGKPLVGALVSLQNTQFGTRTAVDGSFFFAADAGQYVMEVRDAQDLTVLATAWVAVDAAGLSTCQSAEGELSCLSPITGVGVNPPAPATAHLLQNYPNPFNPATTIHFVLPRRERVTLKIFNLLGREIATLVDEELSAGEHGVVFDGKQLASGVYFYRLQAGRSVEVRKMILVR